MKGESMVTPLRLRRFWLKPDQSYDYGAIRSFPGGNVFVGFRITLPEGMTMQTTAQSRIEVEAKVMHDSIEIPIEVEAEVFSFIS